MRNDEAQKSADEVYHTYKIRIWKISQDELFKWAYLKGWEAAKKSRGGS